MIWQMVLRLLNSLRARARLRIDFAVRSSRANPGTRPTMENVREVLNRSLTLQSHISGVPRRLESGRYEIALRQHDNRRATASDRASFSPSEGRPRICVF